MTRFELYEWWFDQQSEKAKDEGWEAVMPQKDPFSGQSFNVQGSTDRRVEFENWLKNRHDTYVSDRSAMDDRIQTALDNLVKFDLNGDGKVDVADEDIAIGNWDVDTADAMRAFFESDDYEIALSRTPTPDAAEAQAEADRVAEEQRLATEQQAEAARLAEERRVAAEQQVEADRIAEESRLEAVRLAEEQRVAAEAKAEADRVAEEQRIAAEEARAEAERLAAEAERLEAERQAEAAREAELEAERLAAEEAARDAANRAEAERTQQAAMEAAEAERIAREAREEAERVAAENAENERLRIEEEERLAEEQRVAAEAQAEAERVAEEARVAAEAQAEADRVAAEAQAEAERVAEEQRVAAEAQAESERVAEEARLASEEAARVAAEQQAEADRVAAEQQAEAERLAAEAKVEVTDINEDDTTSDLSDSALLNTYDFNGDGEVTSRDARDYMQSDPDGYNEYIVANMLAVHTKKEPPYTQEDVDAWTPDSPASVSQMPVQGDNGDTTDTTGKYPAPDKDNYSGEGGERPASVIDDTDASVQVGEEVEVDPLADWTMPDDFAWGLVDKEYKAPPPPEPYYLMGEMIWPTPYRPPEEGYNAHYNEHGIASDAQIEQFNKEYKVLSESGMFSPADLDEMSQLRSDFLAGELSPWGIETKFLYYRADLRDGTAAQDAAIASGDDDFTPASTFSDAKQQADQIYIQTLYTALNAAEKDSAEYNEIQVLINNGAMDFQTQADFLTYKNAEEGSVHRIAMDAQSSIMKDYLRRNDIQLETGQGIETGVMGQAPSMHLNTGTALNYSIAGRDNFQMGEMGEYNIFGFNNPPPPSSTFKVFNVVTDILSVVYPPLAPLFQGAQTFMSTGGDWEAAFESGLKAYAGGKLTEGLTKEIMADAGWTAEAMDVSEEVFDTWVVPTMHDVAVKGDSLQASLVDTATGEIGDYGKVAAEDALAWAKDNLSIDFNLPIPEDTPEWVEGVGDAVVAGAEALAESPLGQAVGEAGQAIIDTSEEIIEGTAGVVEETFEPIVDVIDEGLDYVGEEYVDPALQAAEAAGEVVVDVVDEGLDAIGKVTDPITQAIGDNFPDLTDEALKWLSSYMDLGVGGKEQEQEQAKVSTTPIESLFDKELFTFDTQVGLTDRQRLRPQAQRPQGMFGV